MRGQKENLLKGFLFPPDPLFPSSACLAAHRCFGREKGAGENGKTFGSVSTQTLADVLSQKTGAMIDKKKIVVKEPIREIGDHTISVKLYANVHADVTVTVVAGE